MKNFNIIYGIHSLIGAIQSGKKLKKIFFIKETKKSSSLYRKLIKISKKNNIPIQFVKNISINSIKNKNHQGVFAYISNIKMFQLKSILPSLKKKKKDPILVILDRITDVRNFGAITRTSVCAGADAIIVTRKGTISIGADSVKTSSGALFEIPICRENNLNNTIKFLIENRFKIISTTEKSNLNWCDINLLGPIALIFGNESNGISNKYLISSSNQIKIPSMKKNLLSLNVSVACGIILYEILRQRNFYKKN
ncbi:23S rRNA (guanosine(2251)-2'-O)-methyltransferase RlmB [Blattabacterium cuenoti]|uniref:23S rRNA (guanosine(2251)-2'-O)-methyltransferase RlmB n=1 Tax=Blattabacterium cuenoti TaxID=1653831 RepID=UPI00163CD287|nr:23S rRNA (guanosine(2251)-2'-O)-methyltransferase RlmB [Blattabacterium cuenoti]